ncbi:exported hypothetical protein [Frankia sp. Hr75.2]|nr:exported hypothetical protein [Frankia sp. Hr75.2]
MSRALIAAPVAGAVAAMAVAAAFAGAARTDTRCFRRRLHRGRVDVAVVRHAGLLRRRCVQDGMGRGPTALPICQRPIGDRLGGRTPDLACPLRRPRSRRSR